MSAPAPPDLPPVVLPDVPVNLVTPKAPVVARVVANRICTVTPKAAGWVRHVELDVSGTPLAGAFVAGQSFGVVPPGTTADGKPHKTRLYSLACPTRGEDGEGNVVATTVKRLIDEHHTSGGLFLGVASNYLCDLKAGDEVQVTGPAGKRFVLPTDANDWNYVFVATGTGIAPFRGITLDLLRGGCEKPIYLVAGAPYTTDLLYDDEFRTLASTHGNFKYVTAISRERQDDGAGKLYVDGRLRTHADELVPVLTRGNTLVYLCGLAGMELGVYRRLAELLPERELGFYLRAADPELMKTPETWQARQLNRDIRRTDRVMAEVYD